ncbi:MAG: tetratricopeptide repeat protein [Bacteroides sp.]|nr:tetratricopeptide repeat protein [Roseburia sp.]MCM1346036.1 tetratricopeptide repeat protein [Bacteroides sp.]MCM1420197.1 tetratricopeptide repeat protein [Bacteroides sp.]
MKRYCLFMTLMFACLCMFAQTLGRGTKIEGATKEAADKLYGSEKYEEAAEYYESLIANDGVASELYYNLGNCYYKLSDIPHAILNYERALLLDPGDADIRENLAIARGKTIDKVTPPSEMFFVSWWYNLVNTMSISKWLSVAVVAFILMLSGIFVYAFFSRLLVRKIGIYGAFVLFFVVLLSNFSACSQRRQLSDRHSAIIISPVVAVKSSPSESSTDLFIIHEGSKVEITDSSVKGWREVKFEEGKMGWLPVEAIEVI